MTKGSLNRSCHYSNILQRYLKTEQVSKALNTLPHPTLPKSNLNLGDYVHWCIHNDRASSAMHYVRDLRWRDNTPISNHALFVMALGAEYDKDDRSYQSHEWRNLTWEQKLEWGLGRKPTDVNEGPPEAKEVSN